MTPYDARMSSNLNERQRFFQRRLVAARQNVEQTIGILKQRFNVLLKSSRFNLEKVPKVIMACCVLHNMCHHFNFPLQESQQSNVSSGELNGDDNFQHNLIGNSVRQAYINKYLL